MLRCAAVTRVAAGAAKSSTSDVSHLTRALHHLALAPQLTQSSIRASLSRSLARAFTTETAKAQTAKTGGATTKTRATAKKATKAKPKKKAGAKKKAAPKKKKKVVAKKAAPKRKVLSERQKELAAKKKERDALKALKETALVEPKSKADNAWVVFMAEAAKEGTGAVTARVKEAAAKFKALSPAELEHYNHIANANKASNEAEYKEWVNKHTPEQIRLANTARKSLQRKLKTTKKGGKRYGRGFSPIKDDRQIKRPETGYLKFSVERRNSGDFKNIKLGEAATLIAKEWKELPAGEKKVYTDLHAADKLRYAREFTSAYGHPPPAARVTKSSS